ncbi:peptidase S8/S53 domain-containing protein, partial [Pterulicium gracile]
LCNAYAQLSARGVTILVSTGLRGVGSGTQCTRFDVTFPASCPYVTSVGATELDHIVLKPEIASRYNTGIFSNVFSRPAYQDRSASTYLDSSLPDGMYEGRYNASGRAIPDRSLDEWGIMLNQASVSGAGVLIVQTAFLAGIIALLNEELGSTRLGFLNPLLYENPGMFHDLMAGALLLVFTSGFRSMADLFGG